jgi:hypothetical protein
MPPPVKKNGNALASGYAITPEDILSARFAFNRSAREFLLLSAAEGGYLFV